MSVSGKQCLINSIAKEAKITKTEASRMLSLVCQEIRETVDAGNTLRLAPLGSFTLKHRAARTARNPRTGEPVEVPAKDVIAFKPSK